jgi:hypothetical protein
MPIPAVGLSPALGKLLRIAARSDVAVPLAGRLGARRHALGGDNPLDDAADSQQQRMLERLREAGEQPVTFAELRVGGIDFPAAVVSELELNGYEIERAYDRVRPIGVRLLEPELRQRRRTPTPPMALANRWQAAHDLSHRSRALSLALIGVQPR